METFYDKNGYKVQRAKQGGFNATLYGELIGHYFTYSAAVVRCNCHRMVMNGAGIVKEVRL